MGEQRSARHIPTFVSLRLLPLPPPPPPPPIFKNKIKYNNKQTNKQNNTHTHTHTLTHTHTHTHWHTHTHTLTHTWLTTDIVSPTVIDTQWGGARTHTHRAVTHITAGTHTQKTKKPTKQQQQTLANILFLALTDNCDLRLVSWETVNYY